MRRWYCRGASNGGEARATTARCHAGEHILHGSLEIHCGFIALANTMPSIASAAPGRDFHPQAAQSRHGSAAKGNPRQGDQPNQPTGSNECIQTLTRASEPHAHRHAIARSRGLLLGMPSDFAKRTPHDHTQAAWRQSVAGAAKPSHGINVTLTARLMAKRPP